VGAALAAINALLWAATADAPPGYPRRMDDLQELRIVLSQCIGKWAKDYLNTGRIEGREEGHMEGRIQGRMEGKIRALWRHLSCRFCPGVAVATAARSVLVETRWRQDSTAGSKQYPCHSWNTAKCCCGRAACV